MTPATIMEIALDRVGLSTTNTIFTNRAREYFNFETDELSNGAVRYTFLRKDTTFDTVATTERYTLASDVSEPMAFYDQTNDWILPIRTGEYVDRRDPDHDEAGNPRVVYVTGINTANGQWQVDLWPIPDGAYTILYRYYAQLEPITSGDDSTSYDTKAPTLVQRALVHGIAQHYYAEKGARDDADRELQEKERLLRAFQVRNPMRGNAQIRLGRPSAWDSFIDIRVHEGTLS